MAKAMSSVSAPSPSALSPPAVRQTGAASVRPETGDSEKAEEIIREVRDALRCSGTEEDMIPNFAERMRAAQSRDEMDDILMEQVRVMVQSARKETAEEEAKKTEEKNASDSRDG